MLGFGLVAALLSGCSMGVWRRTSSQLKSRSVLVELENKMMGGEPVDLGFQHPAAVSPYHLRALFKTLLYHRTYLFEEDTLDPVVFPEHQISLASGISQALVMARGTERVRFSVVSDRKVLGVFRNDQTTRGVVFVHPVGVLNVAFDLIVEVPDDELEEDRWGDPTRRTISSVDLAVPEGVRLYQTDSGKTKPLWVTLNLADLPDEPVLEREALTLTPAPIKQEASEPQAEHIERPARSERGLSDHEILSQLRLLEDLHDKGQISEEVYRSKKAELLDSDQG